LIDAGRADIDDTGLAVRVLLETDDDRGRSQRIAWKDRRTEPAIRVTEIGDGVERDIGDGPPEHDMKDQQIVDRRPRQADALRKGVRGGQREPRTGEPDIERHIAGRDRARHRMPQHLAEPEVLEEVAGIGFHRAPIGHCLRTIGRLKSLRLF